jgi:GntR family transcriptional regulator
MDSHWNDNQPIYRQLRDKVVAMILEGALGDGDALPSVRNVAAEFSLNPLTVLKGYQQLVDEQLVEKRRGRGMYVAPGARRALLKGERQKFLDDEWPRVHATIQRLGLDAAELLAVPPAAPATAPGAPGPASDARAPESAADDAADADADADGHPT